MLHIHGNRDSYKLWQTTYKAIIGNSFIGKLFIVVHNKHDLEFFEEIKTSVLHKVLPVCLSQDTMYRFLANEEEAKLFEPFTLSLENKVNFKNTPYKNKRSLDLLILGMCREGKKFREIGNFAKHVKEGTITFSFCGWTPQGSIKESGLFFAIKNGLVNKIECSNNRVEDSLINSMIEDCDAIIDLKSINGNTSYVSSGNISASVSMQKPLIAHKKNYPSFNCIRYSSYRNLDEMICDYQNFQDTLTFHRYILRKEKQERAIRCESLFE